MGRVQVASIKSPQRLQSPALLPKTHTWVKGRLFPTELHGCVLGGLRLFLQRTGPANSVLLRLSTSLP